MQQTKPIGLRRAIKVAVRVRRLERSRDMKVKQQLEALTDHTLIQRMTETPEMKDIREGFAKLGRAGISISDMVEAQKRRRNNRKVYSKNRNIVQ